MTNYMKEAERTVSTANYAEEISFKEFEKISKDVLACIVKMDLIKKAIFYGKGLENFESDEKFTLKRAILKFSEAGEYEKIIHTIHAILGKVTESAELLETLMKFFNEGTPFDKTNLLEEIGDGFWYDSLLLSQIGSDFEKAQFANIAKLRYRYPDKFLEKSAIFRDVDEERKILEKAVDFDTNPS